MLCKVLGMDDRPPLTKEEKLELARRVFREYFAQCFWSWNPDVVLRDEHLPMIVQGLRLHGGHAGYRIVEQLCR